MNPFLEMAWQTPPKPSTTPVPSLASMTSGTKRKSIRATRLVDYAGPCINIPADPAAQKYTQDCVGKYGYMPDKSWKGSGTCTYKFKEAGDTITDSFEEGSHLKEYTYKITGGTGKYQGASGGGTYFYDQLTDRLAGGTYKGTIQLP